jgi:sigma-54 dependent transcriptional regulator, acetoin dehydrogenase operon transcriptional activator AcoR
MPPSLTIEAGPSPSSHGRSDRLTQIDQARRAVFSDPAGAVQPGVPAWLERSWRRCLDMGMQPGQRVQFDPVSSAATRRAIEANQPLLQAAAPIIRSLARAMADTRYFAILTDAQGMVIDVNGPVDRQDPHASSIARVGVDLSEKAVGTTAIGATLAEGTSVWLHRGEHFFNDTSIYSCAGAPLFGPQGQCVGMLDLTGIHVPERPALRHLVTQSARSIENALTLAQPHELLLRLNWPGHVLGEDSDGLVCLDSDGRLTAANRAARDILNLPPGGHWPHCSDVFAIPHAHLFDAARHHSGPSEQPLWSGLRVQVLAQLQSATGPTGHAHPGHRVPLRQVETAMIRKAVEDAQGNVAEAARALGISRATVYRKLERR